MIVYLFFPENSIKLQFVIWTVIVIFTVLSYFPNTTVTTFRKKKKQNGAITGNLFLIFQWPPRKIAQTKNKSLTKHWNCNYYYYYLYYEHIFCMFPISNMRFSFLLHLNPVLSTIVIFLLCSHNDFILWKKCKQLQNPLSFQCRIYISFPFLLEKICSIIRFFLIFLKFSEFFNWFHQTALETKIISDIYVGCVDKSLIYT